jgi:hypothetical protein
MDAKDLVVVGDGGDGGAPGELECKFDDLEDSVGRE